VSDPLYFDDPYAREFDASVTRVLDDPARLVLDRTGFYPTGGGQPADRGVLRTAEHAWRVTDVEKTDTIYHHVELVDTDDGDGKDEDDGGHPAPATGTGVTGELDWDRRYAHMRYHTAQHLLSALLLDEYDAPTTGNQLYADRARIDVGYDRFEEADLGATEARMNDLVSEGRPVTWYEMDRETAEEELDRERTRLDLLPDSITDVRIVEIDGYDRTACAGTHVETTEEIGEVSVTGRETRGKDGERLRFVLDF
jgi:misacylated tRNA(Ala) deacylase